MVLILVRQSESTDNFTRLTVLSWLDEFITLGQAKLLCFCADMLGAVLTCISDRQKEIRVKAVGAHTLTAETHSRGHPSRQ